MRRLISKSSRTLGKSEVPFHSEGTGFLGGSELESGIAGDEGPATGGMRGVLLGSGLRKGGVIVLCAGKIGGEVRKSERRDGLPVLLPTISVKDDTEDCFLSFLMKSPGVVGEGSGDSPGGHGGLPDFMKETNGDGLSGWGGGDEDCELVDELAPPQSFRIWG